jgi:transposase-like protein
MGNCRKCGCCKLVKYGKTRRGDERFKCTDCQKVMNAPTKRGRSVAEKIFGDRTLLNVCRKFQVYRTFF